VIELPDRPTVFFDVDDTLVMWRPALPHEKRVQFGPDIYAVPSEAHIYKLKEHHARGHIIVVWSQGGGEWASRVVKALGLDKYVMITASKPAWFYDDKSADYFMPEHIRVFKESLFEEGII